MSSLKNSILYGILIFTLGHFKIVAQNQINFFDVIEGDSVALYFNKEFNFTEKDCYDYIRRIRVNNTGNFNGYFEDRSIENILLGKGRYINGIKHGYFETYHANGKLFCKGYYVNDYPVGIWEYFHDSGVPERTLSISDSILMVRYVNELGVLTVEDKQGRFDGEVDGIMYSNEILTSGNTGGSMRAIGNIVDGKPDGRWIVPDHNYQPVYIEKFNKGKLVKTSVISKRKMKNIKGLSMLNTFFVGSYVLSLEGFNAEACSESQQYFFNRYPTDSKVFGNDLRLKINHLLLNEIQSDRNSYYRIGDNFMTLQFSVNEKGKAYDIKLLSEWGDRFLEVTKNSIHKTVFSTNNKIMFFHLKLSYAGANKFRYTFRFSRRDQ